MIISTGWGTLALWVPVVFGAAGSGIARLLGAPPEGFGHGTAVGLLVGAVVVWFLGRRLNRGASVAELHAGHPGPPANRHRLFWVPMQYWALVQIVGAIVGIVVVVVAGV
jgi:hypothetical protein